mmetsp:Transcript_26879/g.75540  ORF Transcript_26879/g.75540 Transcript_26879/m.75540 type:complete len:168 (+) Transcript_26879:645-1148(+)
MFFNAIAKADMLVKYSVNARPKDFNDIVFRATLSKLTAHDSMRMAATSIIQLRTGLDSMYLMKDIKMPPPAAAAFPPPTDPAPPRSFSIALTALDCLAEAIIDERVASKILWHDDARMPPRCSGGNIERLLFLRRRATTLATERGCVFDDGQIRFFAHDGIPTPLVV